MLYAISHFADFKQVIIKISHFTEFEQVIIKIVILLSIPRQTASKLLYDDSYLIINKKKEHAKYIITLCILKLLQFFSLQYIRMSEKNINFDDKKIKKSTFCKSKIIYSTDDIDVNNVLVSKKEPYVNKIHLNTLLDIMIMILLDHYVEGFHK